MKEFESIPQDSSEVLTQFYNNHDAAKTGFKDWIAQVDKGSRSYENYAAHVRKANSAIRGAEIASKAAAVGAKLLGTALNVGISIIATKAISAIYNGIDHLINREKEAIEKANELAQAYAQLRQENDSTLRTFTQMKGEFETLASGVSDYGENISLTAEQYQRYREIIDQVVAVHPSLIKGMDAEGNAMVNNNELLAEAIELQKEKNRVDRERYIEEDLPKIIDTDISNRNKAQGKYSNGFNSIINGLPSTSYIDSYDVTVQQELDAEAARIADFEAAMTRSGIIFESQAGNFKFFSEYSQWLGAQEDLIQQMSDKKSVLMTVMKDQYGEDNASITLLNNYLDKSTGDLADYEKASSNIASGLAMRAKREEYSPKIRNDFRDDFQKQIERIARTGGNREDMYAEQDLIGNTFVKMQDEIPIKQINDLQSAYRIGKISVEDYNAGIKEQITTMDVLIAKYPEIGNMLKNIKTEMTDFAQEGKPSILSDQGFAQFSEEAKKADEQFKKLLDRRLEFGQALSEDDLTKYVDQYFRNAPETVKQKVTEIAQQYTEGKITVEQAQQQLSLSFGKQLLDATISDSNKELQNAFAGSGDTISGMIDSYAELAAALDNVGKTMATLRQAQDEMSESGQLSAKTAIEMMNSNENYASVLEVVDGKVRLVENAEEVLTKAKIDSMRKSADLAVKEAEMALAQYDAGEASGELAKSLAGNSGLTFAQKAVAKTTAFLNALLNKQGLKGAIAAANEAVKNMTIDYTAAATATSREDLEKALAEAKKRQEIAYAITPEDLAESYSSSSKNKKDAWLEEFNSLYATLQHRLKMEQITEQQYYDQLLSLNNKYFAGRKKYLDQYRKNLEELFTLERSLFDTWVKEQEHQAFLLSKQKNTEQEQINIYKQLQDKIHQLAQNARALGLAENSEYIQNLQTQWWGYYDKIKSINDAVYDSVKSYLEAQRDWRTGQIDNEIKTQENQLKELEKKDKLEEAALKRQEYRNKLIELEIKLQNALQNKTVANLVRDKDGNWQYDYVADPEVIRDIQDEISSTQKDFDNWELDQRKSAIQDQIQALQEQKTKISEEYEDIDLITKNFLSDLKKVYGDNATEIVQRVNEALADLKSGNLSSSDLQSVYSTKMKSNSEKWKNASESERKALEKENEEYGKSLGWTKRNGVWYDENNKRMYRDGGVADYTGEAILHGTSTKPELVLNNTDAKKLYDYIHSSPNLIAAQFASIRRSVPLNSLTPKNESNVTYHIDKVELPGIKDKRDIPSFFEGIENYALQFAKRRATTSPAY